MPRKAICAWLLTVRSTSITAGNGAGTGRSGSASASSPTVVRTPSRVRVRASNLTQIRSRLACAATTVTSSPSVRHQRCAIVCALFSTAPLRHACLLGQIEMPTW